MNKQEAQNLIIKTFENPFNEAQYTYFIKNLLNKLDDSKQFEYHGQFIPASFRDSIKQYKRIGQYKGPDNNIIDVLIVNLKRETTLERARTFQRNFVAWYLKQKTREAALVAYCSDGYEDWRFSLVKLDFNLNKTKIEIELSPAKRYSFLVGANERSHTAQSQFQKLLTEVPNPSLNELEQAFNIETVTKEFFLEYRDLFIRTKESLDNVIKNDAKIKKEFESKDVSSVDFSKKLLGQIIFLYFLQKKGWFGVERDSDWGTGSKKFLRELLNKKHGDYNNFFNDILEPLFYEALRYDRQDYYYSRFNCKIPFLNGGLFDPINNYDWVHTDITLPNELFSNNNKTPQGDTGDGIFDIFDRYNFTVIEDEPLEKEVAIDPELLGKAYEKFNAIRPDNFDEYRKALKNGKKGDENKFNKQYGVYYTPREIVHYMCRESLINYLASEFGDKTDAYQKVSTEQLDAFGNTARKGQLALEAEYKPNPHIPREDIETLINYGEVLGENEAVVVSKGKETETYSHKLPESIRKNAKLIDEKLSDILVCDPAVGSGAFPVGMMHEIVSTRNFLSIYINDKSRTIYKFKRDCIERSLYGVDIDSGAVEIAKLRLWLSLVVDEDNFKEIKPLPNLDYKIIKGNSLLGFPDGIVKNVDIEETIESLKIKYFKVTSVNEKKKLKTEIEDKFSKLIEEGRNFSKNVLDVSFDFEIYFSEVFHLKKGFDIVIGNPPYGNIFNNLEKIFIRGNYYSMEGEFDAYIYFVEKSIHIIKQNGTLCFIIPNNLLMQKYGRKIRKYLIDNSSIKLIIDLGFSVFTSSVVPVLILLIEKGKSTNNVVTYLNVSESINNPDINLKVVQGNFNNNDEFKFNFNLNPQNDGIINKILDKSILLGKISEIKIGIEATQKYILDTPSHKLSKPLVRGRNFGRYYINFQSNPKYIIYDRPKLHRPREERLFLVKEKILIRQTSDRIIAAIDNEQLYAWKSVFVLLTKTPEYSLRYILAILNSKVINFYYNFLVGERGRAFAQVKGINLVKLPIPISNLSLNELLVNIVDKVISLKQKDSNIKTVQLEENINRLLYKYYNFSYEEVKIIDPEINKIISKEDYDNFKVGE